jgi:aminopeptidase N
MENFWETFSALERAGHAFIQGNAWRIDAYDVTVTLRPKAHSLEVLGEARGTIQANACRELRFLLGLNVAAEDGASYKIRSLKLKGEEAAYEADRYMVTLPLDTPRTTGDTVTLTFHYHVSPIARKGWVNSRSDGPVPELGNGETELCFEGLWLPFANIQFQPVTTTIDVIAPADQVVIFNGVRLDTQALPKDEQRHRRHRFRSLGPGWPTVIAGDFVHAQKPMHHGGRAHFYHQPSYEQVAEALLEHACELVERFVAWFEINPIRDFILVQLQRTSFGQYAPFPMVAFPKDDVPPTAEDAVTPQLTGMLAHEIGHFWFGGLVQSRPNEQWLSEGFAQYMNVLMREALYGRREMLRELASYAERLDNLEEPPQAPLCDIPLSTPNQPLLVRAKGALVLHTLRQAVGLDAFKILLRDMISTYRDRIITTDDVEALCRAHIPTLDVPAFFDEYLRSTQPPAWKIEET